MFGHRIITLSRWLLLLTTVAGVWLWGGTRPWTRETLTWMLLADSGLFLLGLFLSRRLPRVPWPALIPVVFLLCYGWFLTMNCPSDTDYVLNAESFPCQGILLGPLVAFVPRFVCQPAMLLISGLLGAFCIACDLSINRLWRRRLWVAIAACGAGFVALGLAQRFTGAHAIYWNLYEDAGAYFFGTYRYHANAGAYLNLILPLLAGLALLQPRNEGKGILGALWISAALITFAACFVNVSRGAEIVTAIITLLGVPWLLSLSRKSPAGKDRGLLRIVGSLLAVILLGAVLAFSFGTDRTQTKWKSSTIMDGGRLLTYQAILDNTFPYSGYLGTGPGSFESVFQAVVERDRLPIQGRWDKAHNDHLQTLLEWGIPGYLCWAALLLGGVIRGVILSRRGDTQQTRMLGACGALSLAGVLLHAFGDFPLQIPSILLISLCIAGLLWGADLPGRKSRP
jgi:hypothetical protein